MEPENIFSCISLYIHRIKFFKISVLMKYVFFLYATFCFMNRFLENGKVRYELTSGGGLYFVDMLQLSVQTS